MHFPEMLKIPCGKPLMDATHPLDPFELDNTTELQNTKAIKPGFLSSAKVPNLDMLWILASVVMIFGRGKNSDKIRWVFLRKMSWLNGQMIGWMMIIYCNSQGWESRHTGEYLDFRHATRIAWHKQYWFWDEIVKGCVVSNTFFIQMGGPTTKPLGKKTKLTKRNANSVEMERWPHQSCGLRISIELFDRFSVEQIASSDFMNFWSRCVHRFWISKTKNLTPKNPILPPKKSSSTTVGSLVSCRAIAFTSGGHVAV